MKTNRYLHRRWSSLFLALALGWLLPAMALHAQSPGSGAIQGRVYNPAAKAYVGNAEVRLEGTNQVTYTESDGSFRFDHVAAGPATIIVSFTGYNTVKESFAVSAGQPAVREINLTSTADAPRREGEVVQLSAFTVSSEREGNAKAIMAQRRNMNITTSVSSDIFGDVADGNVGEFLKYLPGVDLDYVESEARGPRLGGMDGQYVGVSFDGMRSASADANRGGGASSRATSFEGFTITAIDSIEVNRTASPENDADSPAGTINMKTKRAFDRKGRVFDYNIGANFNGEEFTLKKVPDARDNPVYRWKPNWQLGYSESFFNQRFGLLLSYSHAHSYTEENPVTMSYNRVNATAADPRPSVIRQIAIQDGGKFIIKDGLLLTADWKATERLVLSLNMIYSYFEGEFWSRSFTFLAANDNANVNNGRSTVGGDGMLTVIAPPRTATATVAGVVNGSGTSCKLAYTRQIAPKFEYKIGSWVVDGAAALSRAVNNYEALERGFANNEAGTLPGGWTATRPNQESWEWTIRQNSGADWLNLRNWNNITGNAATDARSGGTRVTNDDRTWITEKWTGTLNARWAVPFLEKLPTILKFGGKWDEESRKNNTLTPLAVWSYNGPGGNTTTVNPTTGANVVSTFGNWANVGPEFISKYPYDMGTTNALTAININGVQGVMPRVSRAAMADLVRARPEQVVNTSTPEDYYTARIANARNFRQTITAGYAQADLRLTQKLQVRFGGRMEQTENALTEFDPLTRAQMLASPYASQLNAPGTNNGRPLTLAGMKYQYESQPRVTRSSKYHNWFPSFLVKYQILPNLEFQAGVNKSISRPPIDNLTGLWAVNESTRIVSAPNPDLQPEFHKVYQSRLAYYFGGRSPGQLSAGLSQDEATNFIQTFDYTPAEFGVDDPDFATYTFRSTRNSTEFQKFRSMDLAYNQTLGFLPSEYLRGVNVALTYARAYANHRRIRIAPHRVTSRLGYNYKRFNGSLSMIWIDDRPSDQANYGRIWGAMTKFDLALTWKLNRYASLFVQGRNITNQKDFYYESPLGVQEGKQRYLRQMEEYGDNWVFGVKGQF
ncbi:MAG: TonB-dependent receptor [Verrucomicrobia bacterium]|nr:TonB-dependent receptor [Verrucomicrobiota bacterium]